MSNTNNPRLPNYETLFVHAGERPDPLTGALAPPLIRTKTYKQPEFGVKAIWEYARGQNPTRTILQEKLSAIESGGDAIACASGLAAETLFFLTLAPGDHLVLPHEVYGGTLRLLKTVFAPYGITFSQTDFSSHESILKAITAKTKYLIVDAENINGDIGIYNSAVILRGSKIPSMSESPFKRVYNVTGKNSKLIIFNKNLYDFWHKQIEGNIKDFWANRHTLNYYPPEIILANGKEGNGDFGKGLGYIDGEERK